MTAPDPFTCGYLLAVANILHLHGDEVIAGDVLGELGVTEGVLRRADFGDYDTKPLRKLFRIIKRRGS